MVKIVNVNQMEIFLRVLVFQIISVPHLIAEQSAQSIPIALTIRLVSMKSVVIHVLVYAVLLLNVM